MNQYNDILEYVNELNAIMERVETDEDNTEAQFLLNDFGKSLPPKLRKEVFNEYGRLRQLAIQRALWARMAPEPIRTIYFIQCGESVKIGITDNVEKRIKQLRTGAIGALRLLGTVEGTVSDEKWLHKEFASARQCGEWFALTDEIQSFVASHCDGGAA